MGLTDKAKQLTDAALLKAGELSEVAREKAPGYIDRAADLAVKAADAAGSGVDRATGGRYHHRIEEFTAKVEHSLDRPRAAEPPTVVVEPEEAADEPITPATTNPDATDPEGPPPTR
ncbi:hypothetical protein [Pseudonocardia adelaidensis]|uniref:Antitoxin protein of toxin-antitoxin system n=1 Tax=Pseudonocardia adelaidensis TaxID=648754 RepID=A0ABP9P904_9PSEU